MPAFQNMSASQVAENGSAQNKVVIGFWHNWAAVGAQGYKQGRFTEMTLSEIPVQYNIIAVAFMKVLNDNDRIPDFKPYKGTDAEFRREVELVQAQGRKVLISMGGADAHIEMHAGDEQALAARIIELTDKYGFDGLDIDLEQAAITAADNQTVIPAALRTVKDHYRKAGWNFIISMAPEFPYLTNNGHYSPYILNLEGYYDYIAPQFYNQGGDGVWVDEISSWVSQSNDAQKEDFLYYLTESLVTGTRNFMKIPSEKFIIGLPTNPDAAGSGYVIKADAVNNALARLEAAGLPIAGLMTWSVNWDAGFNSEGVAYDWEFIRRYGYLAGDGVVPAPQPTPQPTPDPEPQPTPDPEPQPTPDPEPQPTPDPEPQPGAETWREGVRYADGALVSFQSQTYVCVMQHDSNRFWTPALATSLWQVALQSKLTSSFKTMTGTNATPTLRHGHIATPASRAYFAWQEGKLNAGQLNQREAGKFFPATQAGLSDAVAPTDSPNAVPPRDGEIASANQGDGRFLDEPGTHWKKHTVTAGEVMKFTWTYTAPHSTRRYNYFITREDWNPNLPLSRAQFESTPFFKAEFSEQPFWSYGSVLRPTGPTTHEVQLPQRSGYHVLLAVWEVADTGNAFYQVIDLDFIGGGNGGEIIPAIPAGLHATETTTRSVALAWNASSTAGVSYRLYRDNTLIFNGAQLSFVDQGLAENTAYSYTISAVSATGRESARSQAMVVTTKSSAASTTPPTAPVHLHSMGATANSVDLMWGASEGSNAIASYIVYREGDEIARVAASQLSYTDRGLPAETTYRYFVAAVDSQNLLSVPSNVLSVTTLADSGSDDNGNDDNGDNGQYPAWVLGGSYTAGDIVSHRGKNWRCIQTHIAYAVEWAPDLAESLWREVR